LTTERYRASVIARSTTLVALLSLSACATTRPAQPLERAPDPSGRPLAQISLETLDGKRASLGELQAHRPTLLALWATWCDSCAAEFEALRRLSPRAEAQGAYVAAVSEGEARATVADFVRARSLGYPHLVDEGFVLADAIGARSVPTTLVLDRKGEIVYRGAALSEDALRALDRAIGQSVASK
jgi:peroxiredoxin